MVIRIEHRVFETDNISDREYSMGYLANMILFYLDSGSFPFVIYCFQNESYAFIYGQKLSFELSKLRIMYFFRHQNARNCSISMWCHKKKKLITSGRVFVLWLMNHLWRSQISHLMVYH